LSKLLDLLVPHRQWLTLLAVLIAAATIYVWWQRAEAGRLDLIARADGICEAAGTPFRTALIKGRTVTLRQKHWGVACLAEARRLNAIPDQLNAASLDAMLEDLERREGREAVDAALANRQSKRAADAVARMEAADAAVLDDKTTGAWAGAVNDAAGLRHR